MAGSMETKLHEIEVHQHAHGGEVITGVAVPPVNAGSRIAELYQAFTDFSAGALGGALSIVVGQPFDTVKVKLQTYPSMYPSAMQCFRKTMKAEGVPGLFQGTVPAIAAAVGEMSVLFMCYGQCQKLVCRATGTDSISDLTPLQNANAGFVAAFFSAFVLCPTELVKCRLQAMTEVTSASKDMAKKIGPWQVTKDLFKTEGPMALFQGLTSTWLREMPGYFFFFGGYEVSKILLTPKGQSKDDLGPVRIMACGGVAGACLWTAIYPIDVIKSRIQVQSLVGPMPGFLSTAIKTYRTEGARAFVSGMGPCVLRAFPVNATLFLPYEIVRKEMMLHRPSMFE
ncbi:mitochondrial ornithine transporter 1-like [Amphiura filiformis]|uniref:mitochondrial ornithine transporter 1-like n=1 Tax=Amphiura filiformis TaxID=82378 RepID=UPI003B21E6A1